MEEIFNELLQGLRQNESEIFSLMQKVEEKLNRAGYRQQLRGVSNILIVRADVIGDMILTSGFIREVRRNFPRARIILAVSPLTYPLVEFCPYVNEILIFDRKKFSGNFPDVFERLVNFCRENLWDKKFLLHFRRNGAQTICQHSCFVG